MVRRQGNVDAGKTFAVEAGKRHSLNEVNRTKLNGQSFLDSRSGYHLEYNLNDSNYRKTISSTFRKNEAKRKHFETEEGEQKEIIHSEQIVTSRKEKREQRKTAEANHLV